MKRNKWVLLSAISFVLVIISLSGVICYAQKAPGPITLVYTLHTPPPPKGGGTADQAAFEWWTKEIEARTEGRVKFQVHYGAVLGKPTDFVKMVGGVGVADVGNIIGTYTQWQLPLFAGAMQPFLTTGMDIEVKALTRLYNEWAPMREEWAKHNIKPLWWYVIDPYSLIIKKEISRLDDLQGKKIWGAGGFAEIIKKFGITQVFFPATQAYEALQKGTLDGIIFPYGPISAFKFYEVAKVFVDMSFAGGQTPSAQGINLDVWNKISPEDRNTIEMVSAGMHDWFKQYYERDQQRLRDFYNSQGVTFITLSHEEQERIRERCAEAVWADWVEKAKSQGIPAEEFLTRYRAIVKELGQ